jgi:hypothetical protein
MKGSKIFFILGGITLLITIFLLSTQLSKNLQIDNVLTNEFLSSDTTLSVEEINNNTFAEIHLSKKNQNEIKVLFKELKLKRMDDSYSPLNASYRVVSTANLEDQLYLFMDEKVIVFPHKSSYGYIVKNNDEFMEEIETLLK